VRRSGKAGGSLAVAADWLWELRRQKIRMSAHTSWPDAEGAPMRIFVNVAVPVVIIVVVVGLALPAV